MTEDFVNGRISHHTFTALAKGGNLILRALEACERHRSRLDRRHEKILNDVLKFRFTGEAEVINASENYG